MNQLDTSSLFRVILKPNSKAKKVIFFLTSYRAPWFIYSLVINKLRKNGYEVVVYDFKDTILDNEDPKILPLFVENLCTDIHDRTVAYEKRGIHTFDGVGSSLGSFLLYNYCIRFPLRRISLNTVSYMAHVIFTSSDGKVTKTRNSYIAKGYNLQKLEHEWRTIDSPSSGKGLKAQNTLIFTAINDKYVTEDSAKKVEKNISQSNTNLTVFTNKKLGHSASVIKNAHSSTLLKFLLTE